MALEFVLSPSIVVLALNILFFVVVGICALVGFARGTYKSIYYMIATIVIFVGGFLLVGAFTKILLNVDISGLNLTLPGPDDTEIPVTTVQEAIVQTLSQYIFGEGVEITDTLTYTLIVGIIEMAVKIVYVLILVILAFTLFKIIADIIYTFVKPSDEKKQVGPNGKKIRVKKKKSIGSRFLGLGIGVVKGLLYGLLFFFVLAGIVSIAEDIGKMQAQDSDEVYNLVVVDDTLTLVSYKEPTKISDDQGGNDVLSLANEYLDYVLAYRDSVPGTIYKTVKFGDRSIDEILFDTVISARGKNEELSFNIQLRKELKSVTTALASCPELVRFLTTEDKKGFEFKADEKVREELKIVVDELSKLEIIKVVIPVAMEVLILGDTITSRLNNEKIEEFIKDLDVHEVMQIDYQSDIKSLGYAFVDVISLLKYDEEGKLDLDFVALPQDVVNSVFANISELKVLDYFAPIAISYVLTLDEVKSKFEEFGVDMRDINFDDIESWSKEIGSLGAIYEAFCGLGLTTEDLKVLDLSKVQMESIDNLTEKIFDSLLISKVIPLVANYGLNYIPEDYAGFITMPEEVDWEEELNPLLKATVVLLQSGIFTDSEHSDLIDRLKNISDQSIDDMSLYLSQSKIITGSLNGLINTLLGSGEGSILGGIEISGLDSASDWTQTEISSLFHAVKVVFSSGLLDSESDYMATLKELEADTIDDLSNYLSSSKFFRRNLSNLLDYLINQMTSDEESLELQGLAEDEWTNNELYNIFMSIREIALSDIIGEGESTDGIKTLSDSTIDKLGTYISSSKFLTRNLTPLMDFLLKNVDMGEVKIVGFEDSSDWTKAEIVALLKSARLIVNYTDDLTKLTSLAEDDLDVLMKSKLISNVLVDFIKEYSKEGNSLDIIKGTDLVKDGEWSDEFLSEIEFSYENGILDIEAPSDFDVSKYYIYAKNAEGLYEKVASCDGTSFDLKTILEPSSRIKDYKSNQLKLYSLPDKEDLMVEAVKYGEIRHMFKAIQAIIGDISEGIDSSQILSKLSSITDEGIEEILNSIVVSETLICQIEQYATGDSKLISIPEGDLTKVDLEGKKDRSAWLEQDNGTHGELFNALKAITIIFKNVDLTNDTTFSTDMITAIDMDDIQIITNSLIINETLIYHIEDIANGDTKTIYVPSELLEEDGKTISRTAWNEQNETYNALVALKTVFSGSSIDTENLKLKSIIDNRDTILKSLVIVETVKQNILGVEGIDVPENEDLESASLDGWKNTYDSEGLVTSRGEIDAILSSISIVLNITDETSISNISTDSIKLKNVIDHSDDVLKSKVISETIRVKLLSVDGIDIPTGEGLSSTDLTGWKNTYSEEGNVTSRGEINYLLKSIDYVINLTDDTDITNISTDSIKLKSVIDNSDEVLKSKVISETIRVKLLSVDGIDIPENEGLSNTDLDGWKNIYNEAGEVTSFGEISYLLKSIDYVINLTDDTDITNISTDSIKLKNVVDNSDKVLRSKVISETIRVKLLSVDGIDIPENEGLSSTDLDGWKNTYSDTGVVLTRGEINYLLKSINYVINLTDETDISSISTDSIKLKNVITYSDEVLRSKVISETIRVKLLSVDGIDIPEGEGLSNTDLEGWKNIYNEAGTVTEYGEINYLLKSIDYVINLTNDTDITNISTDSIKLKNVVDNRDDVLRSKVISETIRVKLLAVDGINIPTGEGLATDGLTGWKNTYDDLGVVQTRGEINYLLKSINYIINLTDETDISSITTDSIKLKTVIDNSDDILMSKVISETIRVKLLSVEGINIPANEGLASDGLGGWKNIYTDELVSTYGEISYLLKSIDYVINLTDETDITSISTDSIKLKSVIDNSDDVLKSKVISETIRVKLLSVEGIDIPTGEGLSNTDLDGWKNTYTDAGVLVTRGEISYLLKSIDYVIDLNDDTDITNISTDSIKINQLIEHSDDVLRSLVISETIRVKISANGGISIPTGEGLATDGLTGWKNTYSGLSVTSRGEISHLLDAMDTILDFDSSTTINNINTDDIKMKNVVNNSDDILLSLVISETIRVKLLAIDGINIPSDEGLAADGLTGWKNTYDENDAILTRGEISNLLGSIDIILNINDESTITSINTDNIKLKTVVDNSDEILKSKVISETIRVKISANTAVSLPDDGSLSSTNLVGWKNLYNEDGYVYQKGELSYLLASLGIIVNPTEETGLDGFSMNIKLATIIDNKTALLHSLVITSTVKKEIIDASEKVDAVIKLPAFYDETSSPNYIEWKNAYLDEYDELSHLITPTLLSSGEIDYILSAVDALIIDKDVSFDQISSFNYASIFVKSTQTIILKSKVIDETIINKLENTAGLSIPEGKGFDNAANRSPWWNEESGELVYFLDGVGSLLTDEQKSNLSSITIEVNAAYSSLTNVGTRTTLLSSYLVAETLTTNFANLESLTIPTVANAGVDLRLTASHDAWYVINDDRSIEHRELWNLINSVYLLLGDSYDSANAFTIEDLLGNHDFIPTLDENNNNNNDTVEVFLQSKMLEEVFVKLVKDIVIDGAMQDYLNVPTGGYIWYRHLYEESDLDGKEHDLQTILESIYMMNGAGLSYDMNLDINALDINGVSDAFVISRTFKGSIEKTFNGLLESVYIVAYNYGKYYSGVDIDPWDDVKLVQADYGDPVTKKVASERLATRLNTIKTNVNSVY